MRQFLWGLQVLCIGVMVISAVLLVRDLIAPSGPHMTITPVLPVGSRVGEEAPLAFEIRNANRTDSRIVGLNWC